MPTWRRRRLGRLRKRADEHDWNKKPVRSRSTNKFSVPVNGVTTDFKIKFNWVLMNDPKSPEADKPLELRICKKCGQESVNGKLPKLGCKMYIVSKVMNP